MNCKRIETLKYLRALVSHRAAVLLLFFNYSLICNVRVICVFSWCS